MPADSAPQMSLAKYELMSRRLRAIGEKLTPFMNENKGRFPYIGKLAECLVEDFKKSSDPATRRTAFENFFKASRIEDANGLRDLLINLAKTSENRVFGKICDLWQLELCSYMSWEPIRENFLFLDQAFWEELFPRAGKPAVERHFGHDEVSQVAEGEEEKREVPLTSKVRRTIDNFFKKAPDFSSLRFIEEALRVRIVTELKVGVVVPKAERAPPESVHVEKNVTIAGQGEKISIFYSIRKDGAVELVVLYPLVKQRQAEPEALDRARTLEDNMLRLLRNTYLNPEGGTLAEKRENFIAQFRAVKRSTLIVMLEKIKNRVEAGQMPSIQGLIDSL